MRGTPTVVPSFPDIVVPTEPLVMAGTHTEMEECICEAALLTFSFFDGCCRLAET